MANNFNELVNQRKTYYNQLNSYQQYLEQQKQLEQEQAEKAKREEEKKNANFFERAAATVGDFLGQVGVGISKGIEGIVDTASGIVGAVGGLFDKDFQEQVKKNIAYDWTYNKIQNPLTKATKLSYINDASESAQNIIRGVPQTIGQLVPSIAANAVLPGSGMPTLIASAAGSGMEEAYNDGADYYAGFGYGSLVGAVEGTIEKVSGGMARNVFGKGMLDNVATKIASNTYAQKGVKYLLDAGGEALEEYISTTINPYLKRVTYDPNAPLSTQSERIESAIVGGLASMGYRSTIGKIGEKQRNVLENLETVQEIEQKANQQWSKGKLTDLQYNKYSNQIAQAYESAGENLRRMNPDKRSKFMKKYNLDRMFDDEGHYLGTQNPQKVGANLNGLSNADILSQDANNARTINEVNARGVLDTKNKTPATAEVKFSIKKDADGKEYVNIDTDQHLFDGKTASEMKQIAGDVIRNKFQGQIIDDVAISKISRNEYLNSKSSKLSEKYYLPTHRTKMRGATELDNLIKTAKFIRHEEAKHPKSFNKGGYDIYQVDFMLNNELFTGEMLVAKNNGKDVFYDVVKIRSKGYVTSKTKTESPHPLDNNNQEVIPSNGQSPKTVERSDSVDNSIRNNSENVNTNSQKSEKNTKVSSKTDKNAQKSAQNDEKDATVPQKNGTAAPKESISKQTKATEQTQNEGAKYNRKAYSPRLWGKESELRFKPTSKPLNAEQKESLEWFGQMNIHRNFADVVFVDEMPYGANGAYLNGVIYISLESEIPLKTALMHEMTHHLEGSKAYNDYAKFIITDLESNESVLRKINDITGNHWTVEEIRKAYGERYGKENVYDIMSEVVAVYTSEYIFTDSYRLSKLASKNKTLFQKVLNFIKSIGYYFKNKVGKTAQDKKVYSFLNEAQKLYEKALKNIGKPPKEIKGAKYSLANTDDKKDLVVIHNISESKLLDAMELGGLAVPSIAITKDNSNFDGYGNISLIFDKSTIDPLNIDNKVYDADVYSKRFPKTINKLTDKNANAFVERFEYAGKIFKTSISGYVDELQGMSKKEAKDLIKNEYFVKYQYLKEKGIDVEIAKTELPNVARINTHFVRDFAAKHPEIKINDLSFDDIDKLKPEIENLYNENYKDKEFKVELSYSLLDDFINAVIKYNNDKNAFVVNDTAKIESTINDKIKSLGESNYSKWLDDVLDKYYSKEKYFRNNAEPFDNYGRSRNFDALYNEYNLPNIVRYMKGQVRNEEGYNYGTGNIRSLLTKQYKTIEEIKKDSDKIMPKGEAMERLKKESDDATYALAEEIAKTARAVENKYEEVNIACDILVDIAKTNLTESAINKQFSEYNHKMPSLELIAQIQRYMNNLKKMPTEYFEAKPQRAVMFDEVKAIIVPKETDERIIDFFKDKGAKVEFYDDIVTRGTRVKDLPQNLKFSLNKSVDKTASNDVNSSKGAENGRERTTRLEDVPSGDRNGQGDSSTRLGSVQKLQSKKETREVDKINEQSVRDIETQAQIKDFVNSVVSANELKKISSEKRDDIELIESVAQDVGLTPIFCNTDYGTMGYRIYEDRIYLNKEVTPDEFGEILEIERPYKTIPQGQKYVGMSKARLQKIKERFPNAMLTRMRIDDFLKASGNEAIRRKIYSETAPLDVKDLQNVDSDMFLEVDLLGGKVISHEGRHRATALQQAGYTHIDVAIVPMTKETQVLHNVQVKAQESDKTITFGQLIPIDMEFIQDDFINRKSDLKYSLSKGEQNKLVANYTRPKVYSKKETAQIIEDIIDSNLHINDYYGLVKAKDKNATITKLFEDVNKLDGKELDEALYKVADNIIEVAKYRNMYEDMGEVNVQDYEAIKAYRNKLDLSGIKEEIKYRYDDNNVAYLHWSAGKKGGVSIADAVAELREMGVIIRADNDADAFFEMIDTYETLKSEVKAKVEEYSQDKFTDSEISQMKNTIVSDLKSKLAVSGKKSKIQEFKDYYNTRIERLRAEVRHSYAYSRALVKLKTTYDRFKALKNKPADELVVPIVEEMTKAMQKTMTYTGNISKNVRNILRDNFSPIHSKLMELCEQTDNPYIEALRDIANAPSNENLTVQEINVLADVFINAIHVCRNYDKVFWENKRQSETELATNAVEDLKFNSDFIPNDRKFIFNRIMLELNAPYAVFDEMSAFDPDGFMNKAYAELVTGEIKKQSLLSDVDYLLKDVYDKYEKDMKDWGKATVDFADGKITPAQQITMIMSWERPQARQHMENGGVLVLNEKYARKGDFVKAQYDNAISKQVTQQDIDELKSSLKPAQREYIKVAEKIFDDITRNAKIETDVALRGVSNVESGKYIPINVVDEGLARRLGSEYGEDANIFKRNQSVYSYGFNKATKANATNPIAIDDITRVIARHTEDIATYHGYGQFINSFNRIMNKKTESGATLRATLNSINSNFVPYIQQLLKDVQGIGNGRDKAQKVLDTVRNYSYKATLGLNIKSWAMQFVSLFSARGAGLKHSEIMAGVAAFMRHSKQTLAELDSVNPLAHARFRDGFNTDLGRIKAEKGLLGKVDDVTDKLISPMSTIDKWVNGALWEACKNRTNGNIESASKMFNDVLIKTQANWNASLRPQIMRSKNAIIKFATMYMSEPLQLLTRLYTSVVKVQTLLKKKKCDRYNTDAEFREKVDRLLKDAMGNLRVQVTNVAGSMVITTAIALLFKELLKTAGDDDDEKWQDKLAAEFGSQIAGMFPIIRDMYSALQGYDITNSAYTGLQNIVNAGTNLAELSTTLISGKQYDSTELASIVRQTVLGLSQTFGIPVRNAEKYVKAIVDKISPQTAYEWNSLFKSRSASKYYKALENASGNENLQSTILKVMLKDRVVSVQSNAVRDELLRLYNNDINALPTQVAGSYTKDGERIELSQSQYTQVQRNYAKAGVEVEKMMSLADYQKADDETKGRAIKLLYNYYYKVAMQNYTGDELDKFGLFAQGVDPYKLAMYASYINAMKKQYANAAQTSRTSNTLKQAIVKYVQSTNLTMTQKYMLLGYCGYINASGGTQVKSYINSLSLTQDQKSKLYTYSGYKD